MGFDLLTHCAPPRPGPRPGIWHNAAAATASAIAESSVEHRATDPSNAAWDANEQTTGVEGVPLESATLTSAPSASSKVSMLSFQRNIAPSPLRRVKQRF